MDPSSKYLSRPLRSLVEALADHYRGVAQMAALRARQPGARPYDPPRDDPAKKVCNGVQKGGDSC